MTHNTHHSSNTTTNLPITGMLNQVGANAPSGDVQHPKPEYAPCSDVLLITKHRQLVTQITQYTCPPP